MLSRSLRIGPLWVARRTWIAALVAAFAVLATAPVDAQEVVETRAWAHENYGRIVFDWQEPVEYEVSAQGQVLNIRFDRPLIPSFLGVMRYLGDYVTTASVSGDGRTVTFGLTRPFETRAFRTGTAVVVDLLPPSNDTDVAAPAQAPPSNQADAQGTVETLPIRFGRHETYTRVVFDWPRPVGYAVTRNDGSISVVFDRDARVSSGALSQTPPAPISAIAARSRNGALTVVLAAPEEARIRDFTTGSKVVLDVYRPTAETAAAPPAETPEPAATPAPTPTPTPEAEQEPAGQSPETTTAAAETEEPASEPADTAQSASETASTAPAEDAAMPAMADIPADAVPVVISQLDGGYEVRFEWDIRTDAAVFVRAGFLWAAFDSPRVFDLSDSSEGGEVVRPVGQFTVEPLSAVRFRLAPGYFPAVTKDGDSWVITLSATPPNLKPIPILRELESEVGPRLSLPTINPGDEVTVTDPEVGDELILVPLPAPGLGVSPGRRYVDLDILPSAQGVVIRPISDLVTVRSLRDQIEVTSLEGLSMSVPPARVAVPPAEEETGESEEQPATPREQSRASALLAGLEQGGPPREGAGAPMFDLNKWRRSDLGTFLEAKHALNQEIGAAPEEAQPEVLLDFAEFLFANGFAPEALGVVRVVAESDRLMAGLPRLRALRGAANVEMGRYVEAASDLSDSGFDGNAEMALWRGAVALETGNPEQAFEEFNRSRGVVERYDDMHRIPLLLKMARAALAVGDLVAANRIVDRVLLSKPKPSQVDHANLIRAQAMEGGNRPLDALDIYRRLETSDDRRVRAEASYRRVELMLKEGMISNETAAEDLEGLRFAWRGGPYELNLLKRLGELYIADGNYYQGLATWRETVTNFPDSPEVRDIAKSMNDVFLSLFVDGEADSLSPVKALALYREFQELTPVGRLGDEMVYRLADRLVSVDLLGQAAELLQHQVNFRLRDTELARVGARLAAIYLLDGDAEKAADALRASDVVRMPDGLAQDRRYLMVEALSEQKAYDEALGLLEGDKAREADYLRADLYWDQQDWLAVATVINRIFNNRSGDEPLSETEAQYMMKLVVALALSNNRDGLTNVRENYGTLMAETQRSEAFKAITSYVDDSSIDPRDLTSTVADINNYEAFMASLRQRVSRDNLSAIN